MPHQQQSRTGCALSGRAILTVTLVAAMVPRGSLAGTPERKDYYIPASTEQCDPFLCATPNAEQNGPVVCARGNRIVIVWLTTPVAAGDSAKSLYYRVIFL